MSSGIPALDQDFSSKCRESKGLTSNNGPEAKDKDNNGKIKEKDNEVAGCKMKQKDSQKRKYSISGSSSRSNGSSSDSSEEEDSGFLQKQLKKINGNQVNLCKNMLRKCF